MDKFRFPVSPQSRIKRSNSVAIQRELKTESKLLPNNDKTSSRSSGGLFSQQKCENNRSRLTRITVNLLVCCTILISSRHIFGDAIECVLSDSQRTYKQPIELKCWLEGVYVDRNLLNSTYGVDGISPGVGSVKKGYTPDYIQQSYYQWVIPVLLLQTLLLFVPRSIWHTCEGGLMKNLLGSAVLMIIINDEWKEKKKDIIRYLRECPTSEHQKYFIKYMVCESLAFLFLILDMFIMQWVFNGFWTEYADAAMALLYFDFVSFSQNASKLFPIQAKCLFNMFGPSGTIQLTDVVCIMPQNTVNKKIFIFLFFWMIFLVVASVMNMVLIFCKLAFKPLRVREVRKMSGEILHSRISEKFCWKYSDCGYWHLLSLLHRNLSTTLFRDLINDEMNSCKTTHLYPQAKQECLNDSCCSTLDRVAKMGHLDDPTLGNPV